MPPSNHALLSASNAARWIACPPSARLTEDLPDKPSKYAEEGTQAHALCEDVLRQSAAEWSAGSPEGYPAASAACDGPYREPDEMIRAAQTYVDFIHELWVEFEHEPSVFIEQRVSFSRWVPEGFGTCDCLLIGDGILHIVDFKYGMGVPVSPEENPQMMCYALGALELFRETDDIETVRMSIVQPRIQSEPETWEISADNLLRWAANVLAPAAKLAWEGKGELNPGEKQCKFCKAYPACRAWKDKYGPLADFEPLPEPDLLLDNDALGEWLRKVKGLAQYAKDLEGYALSTMLAGNPVEGWKIIEGRSTRQWTDQDAAFDAIEHTGIDPAMLYKPRERITLTEAEKLIGKKNFAQICGQYVLKPPGAPKLAPEEDKRPAYNPAEGFVAEED